MGRQRHLGKIIVWGESHRKRKSELIRVLPNSRTALYQEVNKPNSHKNLKKLDQ